MTTNNTMIDKGRDHLCKVECVCCGWEVVRRTLLFNVDVSISNFYHVPKERRKKNITNSKICMCHFPLEILLENKQTKKKPQM